MANLCVRHGRSVVLLVYIPSTEPRRTSPPDGVLLSRCFTREPSRGSGQRSSETSPRPSRLLQLLPPRVKPRLPLGIRHGLAEQWLRPTLNQQRPDLFVAGELLVYASKKLGEGVTVAAKRV